jgi:trehalose 6-phosphate phosphatase
LTKVPPRPNVGAFEACGAYLSLPNGPFDGVDTGLAAADGEKMPSSAADGPTDEIDAERTALFLDVDGTLLDLAPRPGAVSVPSSLIDSLAGIEMALGGALALVSGRSIDELDRLFAPLSLRASGVHGAQMRLSPNEPLLREAGRQEHGRQEAELPSLDRQELRRQEPDPPDDAAGGLPRRLWMALTELLFDFPGTFAENKRYSFAVHYRTVPTLKRRLRERMMQLIARHPELDLELLHGHSVFEIKSRGFDKGKAIACFLEHEPFLGRLPIFIGDDTTDEAGFATVVNHGGQAFSVGTQRPGASFVFASPASVRRWLAAFARKPAAA